MIARSTTTQAQHIQGDLRVALRLGVLLGQGQGPVPHGLQVFAVVVVGGAQVDAVGGLGRLQGLLPAATRLVELVEEVEALTAPVQLLCLLLSYGHSMRGGEDAVWWLAP
jgi:hypothetical protein